MSPIHVRRVPGSSPETTWIAYFVPKYGFTSRGLELAAGSSKAEAIGNLVVAYADEDELIDDDAERQKEAQAKAARAAMTATNEATPLEKVAF